MKWWVVAFLCAARLAAADTPPATGVQLREIPNHPGQSYWMFVPSNYTATRTWPILYCLDPVARGRVPVDRFAAAAEKFGFLVAGSNNARNGPTGPVSEAIHLMLADTSERFSIDPSRLYAAGFSGGARVSLQWALGGQIAGVIACGAGFGASSPPLPGGVPKTISFQLYATAGFDDFNHDELYRLSRELAKRNVPHRFAEFEGGHDWLPAALADDALGFFLGRVPPQAAAPSKEAEKQAAQLERLEARMQSAPEGERRAVLQQAQKDAAREQDSPDRRVARRLVGGVFVAALETTRELMNQKRHSEAARSAEDAVLARPENASAWFSLAVATAAAGNTKRALEALDRAAATGWTAWDSMENEPFLAKVRRDARYSAILARMRRPR